MEKTYLVFYTADNYNPFRSYPKNYNRFSRVQRFNSLEEARNFAKTVKNADIRDGVNTMKKYAL
ncbi:MAG: hypothetical protein UH241_11375 [Acutalibacteraceae bacterium]|nr:hypothetical protein [Acutalibacteraceae bacterium]